MVISKNCLAAGLVVLTLLSAELASCSGSSRGGAGGGPGSGGAGVSSSGGSAGSTAIAGGSTGSSIDAGSAGAGGTLASGGVPQWGGSLGSGGNSAGGSATTAFFLTGGADAAVASTGGAASGGSATGGTVKGGTMTGGSLTGGSVTGGSTSAGGSGLGGSTSAGGSTGSGGSTGVGGGTGSGGTAQTGGADGGGSTGEYGFTYRLPTTQAITCREYTRTLLEPDWLCTFHPAGQSAFVYVQSTVSNVDCAAGMARPIYTAVLAQLSIDGQVTSLSKAQLDAGGVHGNDFLTVEYQGRLYKFSHSSFSFGLYKCQPMDCLVVYAPGSSTSVETDGCTAARALPEVCVAIKADGTHAALAPDPFKKCADDPTP